MFFSNTTRQYAHFGEKIHDKEHAPLLFLVWNAKDRMNSKSEDKTYMALIGELLQKLSFLADNIKPKIYEYEFLKE